MHKQPLISVIIPCLNEAGTVERLLDQLLEQSNKQLEVIVVDNGSEDGTLKVLQVYTKKGVKVVSGIERGVSRARNAGAQIASGKLLLFLNANTLLVTGFVSKMLKTLTDEPDFKLAAVAYKAQTKNTLFKVLVYVAQAYQRIMFYVARKLLIPGAVVVSVSRCS